MRGRYSAKRAQRPSNLGLLWESSFPLSLSTRKPTPKRCKTGRAKAALHTNPAYAKYYRRTPEGTLIDPYDTLQPLPFGNPDEEAETETVVTEGTGAMRAYQEMLYGVSRHNEVLKEQWRRLLLQYCELDTLAMVMVWTHWTK
jgi:hypothetical protein